MHSSVITGRLIAWSVLLVSIVGVAITAQPAYAASTQVEVAVCNGTTSTAELAITGPASDSVVTNSSVTMSGTIADITQIDVSIDGSYSQSVGISSGQTTFTFDVVITPGTHTISLEGYDICSLDNPTGDVVVTYEPAAPPSNGGNTPTTVNPDPGGSNNIDNSGGNQSGGIIVSDPSSAAGQPIGDNLDGISAGGLELPNFLRRFIIITDLDTITQGSTVLGLLRLFIILIGFLIIVLASGVVSMLWHWREDKATRRHLVKAQIAGLALIVLALLI